MTKVTSRFSMKKPCNNCPFRTDDKAIELRAGRIEGIAQDLESNDRAVFPCHKTNLLSDADTNQHCYGAMKCLANTGNESVPMRMAASLGMLDMKELRDSEQPIAKNIGEITSAHKRIRDLNK